MANPLQALTLQQLQQRTSVKWRTHPPDVLPLFVAEMDVPVARPIRHAIYAALDRGDTGYPAGTGYAEAFAAFADRHWEWKFKPNQTAMVADVMTGIVEALKLLTGVDDAVVVNSPVYTPFYQFVGSMGRRVVESPLDAEHRIDLANLEATFASVTGHGRRAAYLLCNPHNPTGTVHTRDELQAVIELGNRYGVRIVVDEIHAPLVYPDATHLPFLSLPGGGGRVRAAVRLEGVEPGRDQSRPDGRRSRRPRRPGATAGRGQPRPQPPRRDRAHRGAVEGGGVAG